MQSTLNLSSSQQNFSDFLEEWDQSYSESMDKIDLFNPSLTNQWMSSRKSYFVKFFYHIRGHFIDFLWFLGNHAPDKKTKDIVLENLSEEFNDSARSHEQMYMDFAQSMEVDLTDEIIDSTHYLPFIQQYNKGHLKWLRDHSDEERFAAFAAYERLDNKD